MSEQDAHEVNSDRPVTVIGASGLDMIGTIKSKPVEGASNPAAIRVSYGGVGRNVAENLARLGQPVRLVTAVGADTFGQELLERTSQAGVDVHACLQCSSSATSSYLAVLNEDGSRRIVLEDMSILEELTPDHIREHQDFMAGSSLVFVDLNLPAETLRTVFAQAREMNIQICADATSPRLVARLGAYLDQLTMLTANMAEASALCENNPKVTDEASALEAARRMVNHGVDLAVVTLAEFGVVYATSETNGHVPAIRTSVLDPTGAGDALTATIIFGLLNDIPIDEAVRLGVTAASLILRYRGTVLPGLTLEKLYDELVI